MATEVKYKNYTIIPKSKYDEVKGGWLAEGLLREDNLSDVVEDHFYYEKETFDSLEKANEYFVLQIREFIDRKSS